ncbi:MAG: lytic transglycosylase domain-containing protein [Acidobacteria bacterium]|nr:MAG: lytic transglycosylase domain-containing protein [Acidobacteriota bacterium]
MDVLRNQFAVLLGGVVLLGLIKTGPARAEDKIQAVVNSSGRIVFTNLAGNAPTPRVDDVPPVIDNTPRPPAPVIAPSTDLLAEAMPEALRKLVESISLSHGVDPALVRAVIKTESNFNRWAVSPKGARGLMQLIPETGRRYGVRDFFDPQQNVEGGVQYLKFLLEKFNGNLDLSLAAYNAGENLVERLGRIPPIPETTNYVRQVRASYLKRTKPFVPAPIAKPAAPAAGVVSAAPASQEPSRETQKETSAIFRTVDEHGVVHFSNIGPPN